jgi:ML domain
MNKILVVCAILACVNAGAVVKEYLGLKVGQACSNPINAYTVSSFDVTPFPPVKGQDVKIVSVGTFTQEETITGISITIYLGPIKFYTETIPESGTYQKGDVGTFTATENVPSISPSGSYKIVGSLINSSNQAISCWQVDFKL